MTDKISLIGKRVLYVAPRFFGYDNDIANEIESRGAEVVRLFDRPFDRPLMTAVTKMVPSAVAQAALPKYRRALAEQDAEFDLVFVVNGQTLSAAFLDEVRRHSPGATFVLYLWDALDNRGSILSLLGKYDQVFSFDRADARKFGLRYRPLFYTRDFEAVEEVSQVFDLSFIGTAHTDRAAIVYAVDQSLPDQFARYWYLYLQAPWVRRYYARRSANFRRVPASMFHYDPLPKSEISRIFSRSRAILDIEHPQQRGLTMRTFETVGADKKLVTTNRHIADEDFFDRRNILIVDRSNVVVPVDFFRSPFETIPAAVRERYSLSGWLDEILACVVQA